MDRIVFIDRTLKSRTAPIMIVIIVAALSALCTITGGFCGMIFGLILYIPMSKIGIIHPIMCGEIIGGTLAFAAFWYACVVYVMRSMFRRVSSAGGGTPIAYTDQIAHDKFPAHRIEA